MKTIFTMISFGLASIFLMGICAGIPYDSIHLVKCYNCGVGDAVLEEHGSICYDCIAE